MIPKCTLVVIFLTWWTGHEYHTINVFRYLTALVHQMIHMSDLICLLQFKWHVCRSYFVTVLHFHYKWSSRRHEYSPERSLSEASQYFGNVNAYKPSAVSKEPSDLVAKLCHKHMFGETFCRSATLVKINSVGNAKWQLILTWIIEAIINAM